MKQICESCGQVIRKPDLAYRMRIEICADPAPPEFTQEDLEKDIGAEMRAIIERMEDMDATEAEDQVFEAYLFTLCADCRQHIHEVLKRQQMPFDEDFGRKDE